MNKGPMLTGFGAVEVFLAQLIARVDVVTMPHQDKTHLFLIDVATAGIVIGSLAEPRELADLADISVNQMGFQRIFCDIVEGKVIFEDKAVRGLCQNRKPAFY